MRSSIHIEMISKRNDNRIQMAAYNSNLTIPLTGQLPTPVPYLPCNTTCICLNKKACKLFFLLLCLIFLSNFKWPYFLRLCELEAAQKNLDSWKRRLHKQLSKQRPASTHASGNARQQSMRIILPSSMFDIFI